MVLGPILTIGGLITLYLVLGGKVPTSLPATPGIIALLVGVLLFWRLSLAFGPKKKCTRCGASGARRGLLGGMKECSRCAGSGLRDRIGARDE